MLSEAVQRAAPREGPEQSFGLAWSAAGVEEIGSLEELRAARTRQDTHLWVDVTNPSPHLLAEIGECLQLHPLVVEDIAERNQRAKIEIYEDLVHVVMFALSYGEALVSSEIDIVIGERYLLTAHEEDWRPLHARRAGQRLRAFLEGGPDFLLWAIADEIVDGYFPVFDRLEDKIEALQDNVIEHPRPDIVEKLFRVRRELLEIRHTINPQREVFNQLTNRSSDFIRPERIVYFRDVYDHLIRLTDELDTYREIVSGTLEAYLSTVNNNLSEVMRRLTAATVILAGVGAVAGIFGMSEAEVLFREAPGFWIVTAAVLLVGLLAYLFFRRIRWL